MIRHFEVDSSDVKAIGYDPFAEDLYITYRTTKPGGKDVLYKYHHVSCFAWADLCAAESIGKWVASKLKNRADMHPYEKVEPKDDETQENPNT